MLNTAIIGISGYGNTHYGDLLRRRERGEINLLGAAVVNQSEEAEKCAFLQSIGCRIFDSHTAMLSALRGQLDLCFIPTGIDLHAEMAIAAMQAGANVLIEKPAAATVQDVIAMQKAERETSRRVGVGFQISCQEQIPKIRAFCHSREFGAVKAIRGLGVAPRNAAYYRRNQWAGRLKKTGRWILDSPYNNAFAHYLHLALLFSAPPEQMPRFRSVQAQLFRVNPGLECADNGCILAVSQSGIPVYFYASHTPEQMNGVRIVIDGAHGSVEWSLRKTVFRLGNESVTEENTGGLALRDRMLDALFGACHGKNRGFCCDLELAALHTLVVNAAHDSSPVAEVPRHDAEPCAENGVERWKLRGFDEECAAAWSRGRLLDRRKFPWLEESQTVSVENYRFFRGEQCRPCKECVS